MVSTIQIKPTPELQPYISCYALRMFYTGDDLILKPMHAVHEHYMTFFLEDRFCDVVDPSGEWRGTKSNSLCTLLTHSQGYACYKGNFRIFAYNLNPMAYSQYLAFRKKKS